MKKFLSILWLITWQVAIAAVVVYTLAHIDEVKRPLLAFLERRWP